MWALVTKRVSFAAQWDSIVVAKRVPYGFGSIQFVMCTLSLTGLNVPGMCQSVIYCLPIIETGYFFKFGTHFITPMELPLMSLSILVFWDAFFCSKLSPFPDNRVQECIYVFRLMHLLDIL